eukprot:15450039-Alexandrium_andersonii.AAC.1
MYHNRLDDRSAVSSGPSVDGPYIPSSASPSGAEADPELAAGRSVPVGDTSPVGAGVGGPVRTAAGSG